MSEQRTFASLAWSAKGEVMRRERLLAEKDAVIPWARPLALIEPHYPRTTVGRPPHAMETMQRIYFLQQWFDLSDPAAEDAIYDSESMRRFARVELGDDAVPDETTIGVRYRVNRRSASKARPLSEYWRSINRARSRTRARGEHAFHVVKRLWGLAKVRYRGLAKNLARAQATFTLANLYLIRRRLLPPEPTCAL